MQVSKGYIIDSSASAGSDLIFEPKGEPYSCTLNQTDLRTNKNKFYIIQALQIGSKFALLTRYGRIGENGIVNEKPYSSSTDVIRAFKSQFRIKTGNQWDSRDNFKPEEGKYFLMRSEKLDVPEPEAESESEMEPQVDASASNTALTIVPKKKGSMLDPNVQRLIQLFTNVEMLQKSLVNMDIDVKKMPLGKINKLQIEEAKQLLLNLQKNLTKTKKADIEDISSQYYTLIPYPCGRTRPPLIDSPEKISNILDLLDDLLNISVNVSVLESSKKSGDAISQLDKIYESMGTIIVPVSKDSDTWNCIQRYISNTHGGTHHFKLNLLDIFEITRDIHRKTYRSRYQSLGNRELLIHGSRMCNWVSILKNGLLLDPSKMGAVITGKMFGYGIYFANSFSKSAQYCCTGGYGSADRSKREIICFTLAEVALGKQFKTLKANSSLSHHSVSKMGFDSTWGLGRRTPEGFEYIDNGEVAIPSGNLKRASGTDQYSLCYDEKIVYNQDQFDLRFLVLAEMYY